MLASPTRTSMCLLRCSTPPSDTDARDAEAGGLAGNEFWIGPWSKGEEELTQSSESRTKHCWQNYVDYHKCILAKGEEFKPCRQVRPTQPCTFGLQY
jgi:hypothetical protein